MSHNPGRYFLMAMLVCHRYFSVTDGHADGGHFVTKIPFTHCMLIEWKYFDNRILENRNCPTFMNLIGRTKQFILLKAMVVGQ